MKSLIENCTSQTFPTFTRLSRYQTFESLQVAKALSPNGVTVTQCICVPVTHTALATRKNTWYKGQVEGIKKRICDMVGKDMISIILPKN